MRCDAALRVTPSRLSRVTDASESARDPGSESAATSIPGGVKLLYLATTEMAAAEAAELFLRMSVDTDRKL